MRSFVYAALAALLLVPLLLTACVPGAAPATPALTHVRLPMGYIPDVQYAPFYVAQEKGYFREQGLDVEFVFGFETDGVKLVSTGELPMAVVSGEQVVLARSQGLPVRYVMQWFRRFPIAVISKTGANIRTPADLKGKRVGLPMFGGASFIGWRGLLWKNGIKPEELTEENLGGFVQVQALQDDKVDVVVGYANNEPVQLRLLGEEINVLYVADSAPLVANGLMASEMAIKDNPALVRGMVKATLQAIQYTLDHPDEAFAITQKYIPELSKDEASLTKARAVFDESLKLWQGGDPPGASRAEDWQTTQDVLLQMGEIDQPVDVPQLFTNDFVK
jgi:NitT/TauT family transport system substrate-binding protein